MGMIVCCCQGVSDRLIKSSIEQGAQSRADVTTACEAGKDCGACHGMIDELLEEHRNTADACSHPRLRLVPAA